MPFITPEQLYREGTKLIEEGNYERAETRLIASIEADDRFIEPYFLTGWTSGRIYAESYGFAH